MNPVPLFLLAISLPLLLGGCGEKATVEPVSEIKPVEEKVLEVKEEVKPEEPIAETKPKLEGVNVDELELRGDIDYLKGSDAPYTGKSFALWENGQKRSEANWKDGKMDGLWMSWHENGQKGAETNFKDGKPDGQTISWHDNGQKETEGNWKDGKKDGLQTTWFPNGQKFMKGNWKDGKKVLAKYWNPKGEPVNLFDEAEAE